MQADASSAAAAAAPSRDPVLQSHLRALEQIGTLSQVQVGVDPWGGEALPFDSTMATARMGETVSMWDTRVLDPFGTPVEQLSRFDAVVVALSDSHAILLDTRYGDASGLSQAARAKLARVAELIDRHAIDAIRATMDPDFVALPGAGGRTFPLLTQLNSDNPTYSSENIGPRSNIQPGSSNVMMAMLPVRAVIPYPTSESYPTNQMASAIVHELAHAAEDAIAMRAGVSLSAPWYGEALAVSTEEVAARLLLGTEEQAKASGLSANDFMTPSAARPLAGTHEHSPWGRADGGQTAASYAVGSKMLLFARELMGQAGFRPQGPTLHQRLVEKSRNLSFERRHEAWWIESIVEEVNRARPGMGLTVVDFLDRFWQADLTDDIVPDAAASRHGLDRIRSWDNSRRLQSIDDFYSLAGRPEHLMWRNQNLDVDVRVPAGGRRHWFIPSDPGMGVSVAATDIALDSTHHRVRLTRLR